MLNFLCLNANIVYVTKHNHLEEFCVTRDIEAINKRSVQFLFKTIAIIDREIERNCLVF